MLAIDHGYFQGPTTGLERVDVTILPLLPYADTLMLTRGILRTIIPPTFGKGIVLRASGGPSILSDLSNEQIAIDIDEAIRLNVAAMAVQVFVGGKMETQSVHNMTRLVDMGNRYGIPTLGVTAVGKDMGRDAKYMRLACRIIAELGVTYVKTYYVEEGLRHGGGLLSGADCYRGRQEASGARCADHGVQCHPARGGRGGYGPQYFSIRLAYCHDQGGKKGRPRRRKAESGL